MAMTELSVSDLMSTALITVTAKDTIERADLDMRMAGIRHFPVVDERKHLVGIVSDRDVLKGLGNEDSVIIGKVMTTEVKTVSEEMPALEAVEIMLEDKIGCLPVTAEDGHLIGMVTETDFLQVAFRALSGAGLAR